MRTRKDRPLVSICIPLYNAELYIRQTIESILAQSFTDYELIICDDCSSDHSYAIANDFVNQDSRVRVIQNEINLGARQNWNRVMNEAQGTYIKLLHSDDVLYPTCLQKEVNVFNNPRYASVELVTCHSDIIDEDSKRLFSRSYPGFEGNLNGLSAINQCVRMGTNLIGEPSLTLFKTSSWYNIGPFDDTIPYCIDINFWVRLLKSGDLYVIGEKLAAFRLSNASWSFQLKASQATAFRRFLNELRKDPSNHINFFDYISGCIMASIGAGFRQLLYLWVKRRHRTRTSGL